MMVNVRTLIPSLILLALFDPVTSYNPLIAKWLGFIYDITMGCDWPELYNYGLNLTQWKHMDKCFKPCDDFYKFVCNNYEPMDKNTENIATLDSSKQIEECLKGMI